MVLSQLEKKAIEKFVTSAEEPIYALKHTVPPEIFGAFGSYFSRNPLDLRMHLLAAIKGTIETGEGLKVGDKNIKGNEALEWLAEISVEPAQAINAGLFKAQDFFREWYGKYSHKSIANVVWVPMVATNVSQLFARQLAYDQLAFFIEQSSRFVEFQPDNVFMDEDIEQSRFSETYSHAVNQLFVAYQDLNDYAKAYYKELIPYNEWLKNQSEATLKKTSKSKERKYEREINGKALDVSRFLLPQAAKTNLAWILDARSTEFDIAAWKGHPLKELRDAAILIEKHAGQIAPSLLKYTEKNDYYADKLNNYGKDFNLGVLNSFEKGADVISQEEDSLNKAVAHVLKEHNRGGAYAQLYDIARSMNFKEKIGILERIVKNRGYHDEWIETEEAFDLVKVCVEIRSDIGAIRDWRRHQKWDRSEPSYTLDNGYHLPYMVNEMHPEARESFEFAMHISSKAEREIRKEFPFQAQYVLPMAANHSITMSGGLDQMQYMLWTRSTPQGNFSYREDAFNLAEATIRTHPWLLGYEKYPEGKGFMEVYEQAPLKNLFRLQTGELGMHE